MNQQRGAALTNREKDDFYPTPDSSMLPFFDREGFLGPVWEPACGDGAMSEMMQGYGHKVVSTDLVDRGYGTAGIDFLMETELLAPNIVTNPPYKLAQEFIQKAIDLGAQKHCWLLRLAFLEGVKRFNELYAHNPPARLYVFSKRQTMIRGDHDEAWYGSGKMAFMWAVWIKDFKGTTELDWI